jgi:PAS domain S-box-containing protein
MDQWQRETAPSRVVWHHVAAVAAGLAAVSLRRAADSLLGADAPFLLLYPTTVAFAFLCGRGPALSASIAGAIAAIVLFDMSAAQSLQGLVVVLTAAFVSWMITRRQGLEQALATSEQRFRSVFEHAPVGIEQVAPDGRLLVVNPALCELLGYSREDLRGRTIREITHPDDRDGEERELARLAAGTADQYVLEKRYLHRDGTAIWVRVASIAVRTADGAIRYRIAVVQDIREQRQAAEVMERALHLRDEFLSIASHELRTPLTSLQLQIDSLLRRSQRRQDVAPLPDWALRKLSAAEQQIDRLSTLTSDLLDVSRITTGRMPLRPEPVDVGGLIGTVAERCRGDLESARCTLTINAPPGMVAHWDRLRVEQILTNLLTNAMKYGAGKPVTITVETADDMAAIHVIDHGIGIDAPTQQRIFDRFERGVSHRNYGGFGVGLWIARQAATALGGTITVQSEPGHGATFTVRLPLQPAVLEDAG